MPKENTHLYFADNLIAKLNDEKIKKIINKNLEYYYFGSVTPDLFYFSLNKSIRKISDYLHGKDGNLTNEVAVKWLTRAKEKNNYKELAFIFGYLTHCVLDSTLHPLIYYLTGNYYDPDPAKEDEAIYQHRRFETNLDRHLTDNYYFKKLVSHRPIQRVRFFRRLAKEFKVKFNEILKASSTQLYVNKLFLNGLFFNLVYYTYKLRLMKHKTILPLFYGNIKKDPLNFPFEYEYQDIITGEKIKKSLSHFFDQAYVSATDYFLAASNFFYNKISTADFCAIVDGKSLDTGKVNCPVSEIKYTLN